MKGHITPPTPHIVSPSRGQIGAIAVGAYTEIVSIIAPASASPGDLVTVEVRVRKLYEDWLPIMVGGWLDDTEIWFSPEYKWFEPGDIQPFPFTHKEVNAYSVSPFLVQVKTVTDKVMFIPWAGGPRFHIRVIFHN
ncbi:unnamed protein product [marine sediment metagenome]|uniref:Uncharacterized protein n=1 Tax=marine sediment metagenome TaxID=412755 RepID=X1SYV0_9ZZZZ